MTGPYGPPPGPPGFAPRGPALPPVGLARRSVSLLIDLALTLAAFAVTVVAAKQLDGFFGTYIALTALLGAAVVSLLNRVALQRITGASLGKLLTDLVVVDRRTGRRPAVGALLWAWFCTLLCVVELAGNGSDAIAGDPFPAVVRRGLAPRG